MRFVGTLHIPALKEVADMVTAFGIVRVNFKANRIAPSPANPIRMEPSPIERAMSMKTIPHVEAAAT